MKKNALIVFDSENIKVVFGSVLKCFKISEVNQNKQFLERLFNEANVFVVEKAAKVTLETLINGINSTARTEKQDTTPVKTAKALPKSQVATPQPREKPKAPAKTMDDGHYWIKSSAKTTIMIDDLFTNEEIIPGVFKSVAVPFERAVDLSNLPTENISKSNILKRLLASGKVIRISTEEAQRLMKYADEKEREDEDARSEILDRPVSDMVGRNARRDVEEYDITADVQEETPSGIDNNDLVGLNEDGNIGMSQLKELFDAKQATSESDVEEVEEIQPRQLAQRPKPNPSGPAPRSIMKRAS